MTLRPKPSSEGVGLSADEVRRHASKGDCWIAVHSRVYDVTAFLDEHPGGADIILEHAGGDATKAYDEIHAPSIISETLPPEALRGSLAENEVRTLLSSASPRGKKKIPNTAGGPSSPFGSSGGDAGANANANANDNEDLPVDTKPPLSRIINSHDFEAIARRTFSRKAWAFYSSAATDLVSHRADLDIFRHIYLRPRYLRDVAGPVATRRSMLGCESGLPFFVSPCAMARLAHPDGELAIARACSKEGVLQMVSSNASYTLPEIVGANSAPAPFFLQLYVNKDRRKTEADLRRAASLGARGVFVTIDAPVPGKREADERANADTTSTSIGGDKVGGLARALGGHIDPSLSFKDLRWIKAASGGLPLGLKGVACAADAKRAAALASRNPDASSSSSSSSSSEGGVGAGEGEGGGVLDAIILSNHGGRALDTAQPALVTLLEIHRHAPEVFDFLEVYVDGGVRRGTDVVKALALGATGVGVGRPYLYSLAYGEEGARHLTRMLMSKCDQVLREELETTVRLCGATDIDQLGPDLLNTGAIDRLVPESDEHPYVRWKPKIKARF